MGESMSPQPSDAITQPRQDPACVATAAWHSLFWLVFANSIGVLIAVLLLFPSLNHWLGEWTYGRWIIVHMNLELYGWSSLPMAGFLFKVYGANRGSAAQWCRPVLWVWSAALVAGTFSWLSGNSSGKLFLDWSGTARVFFPLAMIALWLLLSFSLAKQWRHPSNRSLLARSAKLLGLALLLAVPAAIYIASSPNLYPPVNPDTGGPTGASQLESSLIVVAILLMLPFGLTKRKPTRSLKVKTAWVIFAAESLLCIALGRNDVSHRLPAQFLSLASLLLWIPLTPIYYTAFQWDPATRRWRNAFLAWWSVLLLTGWALFLPGVLDHFKFTDGLVGHSLLAMAGFVSALLIFVMVQLLGDGAWIFNRTWSFYLWNISVFAYVILMFAAGWREGFDPSFSVAPGVARNIIYVLRLIVGLMMFAASLEWLIAGSELLRESKPAPASLPVPLEKTA
jgi:cytochrome c oxidase cbb3-type subunit 1